jgi:hypothetical protein
VAFWLYCIIVSIQLPQFPDVERGKLCAERFVGARAFDYTGCVSPQIFLALDKCEDFCYIHNVAFDKKYKGYIGGSPETKV